MQSITAKAEKKILSQFITIYQPIISFSLEKMGLDIILKLNKSDPDNMLDDVNAHLIDVCENFLNWKKMSLDKYQLATIVMDLFTTTVADLDSPFRVLVKESKNLVQEYLQKNKSKRETLERIKKENDELDKEYKEQSVKKKSTISKMEWTQRPGTDAQIQDTKHHQNGAVNKPKQNTKWKYNWNTNSLAIDNFSFL